MYKVIFISNNRPKRFFRRFNTLSEIAKYLCENSVKTVRCDKLAGKIPHSIKMKEMSILMDKVISIENKKASVKNAKEDAVW